LLRHDPLTPAISVRRRRARLQGRAAGAARHHVGGGDREMDGRNLGGRSEVMEKDTIRIAAVADIHTKKTSQGTFQPLFAKATEQADVLLLCGDLTDYGAIEEAKILAKEITSSLRIPALGVLGNHDVESDHEKEI